MVRLERRIAILEKTASLVKAPRFVVEFVSPVCGAVGMRHTLSGNSVMRLDYEREDVFVARAARAMQQWEIDDGQ